MLFPYMIYSSNRPSPIFSVRSVVFQYLLSKMKKSFRMMPISKFMLVKFLYAASQIRHIENFYVSSCRYQILWFYFIVNVLHNSAFKKIEFLCHIKFVQRNHCRNRWIFKNIRFRDDLYVVLDLTVSNITFQNAQNLTSKLGIIGFFVCKIWNHSTEYNRTI